MGKEFSSVKGGEAALEGPGHASVGRKRRRKRQKHDGLLK